MRARVPALLLLACVLPARAAERGLETPTLNLPQGPKALPDLAMPLMAPITAPGLAALSVGALPQATALPAATPQAQAQALSLAPSALPQATAQAKAQALPAAKAGASESGWLAGSLLFDHALERDGGGAGAFMSGMGRSAKAAEYRAALDRAEGHWKEHGDAAIDAGLALLAEKGVKAERKTVIMHGEPYHGLTIVPEPGLSPLNDLAYELKKSLGASVDHAPQRTEGGSALFNAKANSVLTPDLDRPDFFLGTLHEARHAWYSAAIRRGEIKLFHLQIVAHRGRKVAPDAASYQGYLSFEELSTFPKTLKHLVTERAKAASAEDREFLESRARNLAYTYADILRTAEYVSRQIRLKAKKGDLEPARMPDSELEGTALLRGPDLDFYMLPLWQGNVYLQVPRRDTKMLFGGTRRKSSVKEARTQLLRRAELIDALVGTLAQPIADYYAAAKAGEWTAASARADAMVAAVRDAETAWAQAFPGS